METYTGFFYQITIGRINWQITGLSGSRNILKSHIKQEYLDQINNLEPNGKYGNGLLGIDEIAEKLFLNPHSSRSGEWD